MNWNPESGVLDGVSDCRRAGVAEGEGVPLGHGLQAHGHAPVPVWPGQALPVHIADPVAEETSVPGMVADEEHAASAMNKKDHAAIRAAEWGKLVIHGL